MDISTNDKFYESNDELQVSETLYKYELDYIPEIVLTSINNFQEYILDNIANIINIHALPEIKPIKITIITNRKYFSILDDYFKNYKTELINYSDISDKIQLNMIDCDELDDMNYNNTSRMDKKFRNGFWHLCKLRLVYLYAYMNKYNLNNIIHIENDVLIYTDLYTMINTLVENINTKLGKRDKIKKFPNKLLLPFDCKTRAIISIMFIPTIEILHNILVKTLNTQLNDMEIIPSLFNENETYRRMIGLLPIAPVDFLKLLNGGNNFLNRKCEYETDYNDIYDAAAIGQYLGGVDPRNISGDTRGFINETCIVKYNLLKFKWFKYGGLYKPWMIYNSRLFTINNLHIHCKNLKKYMASYDSIPLAKTEEIPGNITSNLSNSIMLDIVIVLGPNDINMIEYNIKFNSQNIINARNMYIITPLTILNQIQSKIDELNKAINTGSISGKIILIDEAIFPFTMADIGELMGVKNNRNGWYLQQLLKLYVGNVVPGILDNYLVVDTDTIFTKPTLFIDTLVNESDGKENGDIVFLFNHGIENNDLYFKQMTLLHPSLRRENAKLSGICHHMLFNRVYINEIIKMVEEYHASMMAMPNSAPVSFWKLFIEKAIIVRDSNKNHISCASEYEIYFNYMVSKHNDKIKIRKINYYECSRRHILNKPRWIPDVNFNYYCFHHYL